jgi:hypothetical protein
MANLVETQQSAAPQIQQKHLVCLWLWVAAGFAVVQLQSTRQWTDHVTSINVMPVHLLMIRLLKTQKITTQIKQTTNPAGLTRWVVDKFASVSQQSTCNGVFEVGKLSYLRLILQPLLVLRSS